MRLVLNSYCAVIYGTVMPIARCRTKSVFARFTVRFAQFVSSCFVPAAIKEGRCLCSLYREGSGVSVWRVDRGLLSGVGRLLV